VALALVGLGLAFGVALVDAPGRVLVGAAALLLLVLALRDVVARPRLSAGPDGVVVRTGATRRRLRWEGLRIRARDVRRFGVRGSTLELDTASGSDDEGLLVVLGRWDLGDDPGRVAGALERLRPGA
jgi:hypothetical protein